MAPGATCDASQTFPAPAGGPAATWSVNGYTYLFTPGTPDAAPVGACTSPGTGTFTFTATPTDATLDGYLVDDSFTVRHGTGAATVTSNPIGQ